jgi:MFS family permease
MFLVGMAMFGAFLYIPLYAQGVLGRSATNSGIIMMPLVLSLVPTSIITGQLVSRSGKYKKITIFGMAMVTIGLLSLSTLTASSTNSDLIIRLVVAGIGLGIAMPIFNLVVQNALPQSRLGVATSSVQLFRSLGATVGVAIMGSILNNRLVSHLGQVVAGPATQVLKNTAGKGIDLAHLHSNQLQGLITPEAQHATTAKIAKLPAADQQTSLQAYAHFVSGLKAALSSSIAEVFLISGLIVSIAFFAAWFLKEVPLRGKNNVKPLVSEGGVPGSTH